MPIPHYQLDDRRFNDLVDEMLGRIPGHTPEWTNPQPGDPGRTLIELFAWMGDMLLYRANLVPERQRLEFLRLLNMPLEPARAARGLVALAPARPKQVQPVDVPIHTAVRGPATFETTQEITVIPVVGRVFAKRRPTEEEAQALAAIRDQLEIIYGIQDSDGYVTTPLFETMAPVPAAFDMARDSIDQCLWIALLTAGDEPSQVDLVRQAFTPDQRGTKILSIGLEPQLAVPHFDDMIQAPSAPEAAGQWDMPSSRSAPSANPFRIPYLPLDIKDDSTLGFTRTGVVRLHLPHPDQIALPPNSVDEDIFAGTGNRPPRIDDENLARRLVTWIRLRPSWPCESLAFNWVGLNAVTVDQRKTLRNIIVATANGAPDQTVRLPSTSVDPATFELEVEEPDRGFVPWREGPLHACGRDDRVFGLDAEAGLVRFGDGMRGAVPETGQRIRIPIMRCGGGTGGNLAAGNLNAISHPELKLVQPVASTGGSDAESLEAAEKRIPSVLKHHHRAVTAEDYRDIALHTPGLELGRVEVLPKFKPQQRLSNVVGVVSVMILPRISDRLPPNPRPDRRMLARAHDHLEARRPIGVELYVIGVDYVPMGVAAAVRIREGFQRNQVLQNVMAAIRTFLWPLPPGGHQQQGWSLGRPVVNQEIEVMVARVPGVLRVRGINLFRRNAAGRWEAMPDQRLQTLTLEHWQLPELLAVTAVAGDEVPANLPDDMGSAPPDDAAEPGSPENRRIPIPVVPEMCR